MARLVTEWVKVTGDISIMLASGRGLVSYPGGAKEKVDPFATLMTGVGAMGSTVTLLDGAISLGFAGLEKRLARPDPTIGAISLPWSAPITRLSTRLEISARRQPLHELGRPEVAAYLELRAREETGHDRLALKDLRALGVPGERLVATSSRRASSLCASASMTYAPRTIRSAASDIRTA